LSKGADSNGKGSSFRLFKGNLRNKFWIYFSWRIATLARFENFIRWGSFPKKANW
jgi:hypothetical protein